MPSAIADEVALQQWARLALVLSGNASFTDWCEWFVRIESDAPGARGPIPLDLYPYQLERAQAWERGDSEVILKARQLGFSWLAAAFALWTAAYHPSSHVAVLSAGAREMRKFMRRVRFIWRRLPPELQAGGILAMESITFANESMISGFPSTEDAGIGETNRLVVLDEWAFHPYGEANLSALLPTIAAGGQLLGMSTADPSLGPSGHFYGQWEAASDGRSGFSPVFVPWNARPGRDDAWLARERARHIGSEQAFRAFYPAVPADAFQGREGLVYPMFDPEVHLRPTQPLPWRECLRRYYALDLGGGDPTAAIVGGVYRRAGEALERIHIYGLHYRPRNAGPTTVEELYGFLEPWHSEGPFFEGEGDPAPGGETVTASLRGLGLPGRRGRNDRVEGIDLVTMYLKEGWLTFDDEALGAIVRREMASYRWVERTDPHSKERYATRTPVDNHGDVLDAVRLLVMGAYYDTMGAGAGGIAYAEAVI